MTTAHSEIADLQRDGFVVLQAIVDPPAVVAMLTAAADLLREAGRDPTRKHGGTLHLDDLRDLAAFAPAWQSPRLWFAVASILGAGARVARVGYRAPRPGFGAQVLHPDWNEPIDPGREQVATAIVALVDFTRANGATRVIPGSHRLPRVAVPDNPNIAFPREHIVTPRAGDAIVFSGHLRHSGTRNRSESRRDSLQISFER
jgi:hypothetical protein